MLIEKIKYYFQNNDHVRNRRLVKQTREIPSESETTV